MMLLACPTLVIHGALVIGGLWIIANASFGGAIMGVLLVVVGSAPWWRLVRFRRRRGVVSLSEAPLLHGAIADVVARLGLRKPRQFVVDEGWRLTVARGLFGWRLEVGAALWLSLDEPGRAAAVAHAAVAGARSRSLVGLGWAHVATLADAYAGAPRNPADFGEDVMLRDPLPVWRKPYLSTIATTLTDALGGVFRAGHRRLSRLRVPRLQYWCDDRAAEAVGRAAVESLIATEQSGHARAQSVLRRADGQDRWTSLQPLAVVAAGERQRWSRRAELSTTPDPSNWNAPAGMRIAVLRAHHGLGGPPTDTRFAAVEELRRAIADLG